MGYIGIITHLRLVSPPSFYVYLTKPKAHPSRSPDPNISPLENLKGALKVIMSS